MGKYYVKYETGSKCKNSAEVAANNFVETLDGILLSDILAKEIFIKDVKAEIDKINLQNRRCRDVRFSTWNGEGVNISVGEGICYLRIYKVKKEI
ncbi:hypothetical protein [Bacteroides sp. 51]|uniref:hypothetical protein n=1 Tax=Bacteroides sp. 51 TaxID=2302938 RepID=UPI0013D372BC|nr:hypothetical protein [Bacteroides sp. 51]NDV83414.1 hypothetical protein [Bacteroides sp. 51]